MSSVQQGGGPVETIIFPLERTRRPIRETVLAAFRNECLALSMALSLGDPADLIIPQAAAIYERAERALGERGAAPFASLARLTRCHASSLDERLWRAVRLSDAGLSTRLRTPVH